MPNKTFVYGDYLKLWAIQESLLQRYWGAFLASQSILIGAGAFLTSFGANAPNHMSRLAPLILLFAISCVVILTWVRITKRRTIGVACCQEMVDSFVSSPESLPNNPIQELNDRMSASHSGKGIFSLENFWELFAIFHKKKAEQQYEMRPILQAFPFLFFVLWIIKLSLAALS